MTKKNDFSLEFDGSIENSEATSGEVFDAAERGRDHFQQQATASPEEQLRRKSNLSTQGRKGCKTDRLNLALTPENYKYIFVAAPFLGYRNPTKFLNDLIEAHRAENPHIMKAAAEVQKKTKGILIK